QVSTTWVDSSKRSEALWREPGRARLALDRDWLTTPSGLEDKVNLVMLLVAPVVEPAQIEARAQLTEDEMLEEESPIRIAQAVPFLEVGDEACVERVHLWLALDLGGTTTEVGPHEGRQQRGLEDREVVLD